MAAETPDNLVVIYQPCNQFGKQEPTAGMELRHELHAYFVRNQFPITDNQIWLERTDVNGDDASPLFKYFKETFPNKAWMQDIPKAKVIEGIEISWNFEKFIFYEGEPILRRYKSGEDLAIIHSNVLDWIQDELMYEADSEL